MRVLPQVLPAGRQNWANSINIPIGFAQEADLQVRTANRLSQNLKNLKCNTLIIGAHLEIGSRLLRYGVVLPHGSVSGVHLHTEP